MRDIVVLYGAGASYGAGDILPESPPLGSGLFEELARVNPRSWGALPDHVAAAFSSGNFESGMGVLYEQYVTAVPQLLREMAVYLVQFRPHSGRSCYCALNRFLQRTRLLEQVTFSTLNYDCVLEFSLSRQSVPFRYFKGGEGVPLLKLHGSCNWFSHGLKAGEGIHYTHGVIFEGGIEAAPSIEAAVESALVNQGLAPVMSLYMEGKPLQISPGAVRKIQEDWQVAVRSARTLVCVGVRPWPADTHIWDSIATTEAELLFVGDEAEFDAWTNDYRDGPSRYLGPYFDGALPALTQALEKV